MNVVTGSLSKLDDFCSSMAKLLKSKNSTSFSPYCSIKDTACLSALVISIPVAIPVRNSIEIQKDHLVRSFLTQVEFYNHQSQMISFVNIIIKRYLPRVPGHKFIYFGQNLCPKNNPKHRSCLEEEVL